jgi:dienelactone hydrolase
LQGTRDALADSELLKAVIKRLEGSSRTTIKWYEHADHSFHVPARSGRNDSQVRDEMLDDTASWIDTIV